jgi:hypothetical protein
MTPTRTARRNPPLETRHAATCSDPPLSGRRAGFGRVGGATIPCTGTGPVRSPTQATDDAVPTDWVVNFNNLHTIPHGDIRRSSIRTARSGLPSPPEMATAPTRPSSQPKDSIDHTGTANSHTTDAGSPRKSRRHVL